MSVEVKKEVSHYDSVGRSYLDHAIKASGLAEDFFALLKEQVLELGDSAFIPKIDGKGNKVYPIDTAFLKATGEMEANLLLEVIELTNDLTMTFSKYVGSYKVRKSNLRRGIKNGVDPRKFDTYTSYIKAADKVTGGNSAGGTVSGKKKDGGTAKSTNKDMSTISVVTSNLPDKLKARLGILIKHLAQLPEDQALRVIQGAEGAIGKLQKVGGKFSHVKTATS